MLGVSLYIPRLSCEPCKYEVVDFSYTPILEVHVVDSECTVRPELGDYVCASEITLEPTCHKFEVKPGYHS